MSGFMRRPQQTWNPLGSSPEPYEYHQTSHNWRDSDLHDIGLGISSSEGERIPRHNPNQPSIDSDATKVPTPQTTSPHVSCPNDRTVLQKRLSWIPITIFVLALYATVWSGIYLAIALWKPRWPKVSSDGPLKPDDADTISAAIAKSIELSYVTVCVAFLGQVLSRRALMTGSRGISISDMSMRAWIMQPGSMIVHWETVRYSALTFLGATALTATIVSTFYTTAAQALVAPNLSMGPVESKVLQGKVAASFAHPGYIPANCKSPTPWDQDRWARNTTCIQIEHSGHSYRNYQKWLTTWVDTINGDNETSSDLKKRPAPSGSIWDNTTITGSWIETQDVTALSEKYGRMVINVTMAMPHGGIPLAAINPKNGIKQPRGATGEGKYDIEASVASPAVNVICAGMDKEDLAPLVFTTFPQGDTFVATNWTTMSQSIFPKSSMLNRTIVDDLFEIGPKYGQFPPIFGKYPEPYNTILNQTILNDPLPNDPSGNASTQFSIYLLGATAANDKPPYIMCGLRAKLTGHCSTKFHTESSGASLTSHCDDPKNDLQYNRQHPDMREGEWKTDWKNVASEWANSLSLGAGITDGAASNARLLMQLLPRRYVNGTYKLDPKMPSIAEALAVMAGSTLILSTQDAPFYHDWNYTKKTGFILDPPVYERFNATVQEIGYASGGAKWQGVFYVVLVFAFLTSAICLVFMIVEARGHQVTDFTEPQNLFAIAVNSPQNSRLAGACGCGPCGTQLKDRWFIGMEENDEHYYIGTKGEEKPLLQGTPEILGEEMLSPVVDEFRRVSKRNSVLGKLY
ncbi:unnamed protein product [Penicillium olsonii]|uniref:Uncharacterized protein n=1 Tax=Penicillium olsonii TaxID=99116 RepID=A0A9W4MVL9_PENOL|nr:unnamed protein product [Penicillium olsonii]CAG8303955.1 unnamed protein product [Penicillium olsonii]